VAALEKAAELAPQEAAVLVDYACALVRYRRDPRLARQYLEAARKLPISDVIGYAVDQCQGMIALAEGNPFDARDCLNQALAKLRSFRHGTPLIAASIDRVHALLALANAAAGDLAAARRHYQLAEPRLRALRMDDLVQRCEAVPGLTTNE
jgi:hypothetical protein